MAVTLAQTQAAAQAMPADEDLSDEQIETLARQAVLQGRRQNCVSIPLTMETDQSHLTLTVRPAPPLTIRNSYLFARLSDRSSDARIFNNHIVLQRGQARIGQ